MNEIDVVEMKKELTDKLIASGVPREEASRVASKEVDSLGIVKTSGGKCPLGSTSAMACMFCSYGHMTECHYPLNCEQADCSHHQAELSDGGDYADLLRE